MIVKLKINDGDNMHSYVELEHEEIRYISDDGVGGMKVVTHETGVFFPILIQFKDES